MCSEVYLKLWETNLSQTWNVFTLVPSSGINRNDIVVDISEDTQEDNFLSTK